MTLSVCIATYRRTERLAALLDDLARQTLLPEQVVVVDNDAGGSARSVIEHCNGAGVPYELRYGIQPERNIALTRNVSVSMANGELLVFVDDDQRAPATWLRQLVDCATANDADAVLGAVEPVVPADAPAWVHRGNFYDFPKLSTGQPVPLNRLRIGNALVRGSLLRSLPGPFDVRYGLATGEDADMLIRLVNQGARIVASAEAKVQEPIERARLKLRWLLQRGFSGGQEFARKATTGKYGTMSALTRSAFYVRAGAQLGIAALLSIFMLPVGRHHCVHWLIVGAANFGKLSTLAGWRYSEYA